MVISLSYLIFLFVSVQIMSRLDNSGVVHSSAVLNPPCSSCRELDLVAMPPYVRFLDTHDIDGVFSKRRVLGSG